MIGKSFGRFSNDWKNGRDETDRTDRTNGTNRTNGTAWGRVGRRGAVLLAVAVMGAAVARGGEVWPREGWVDERSGLASEWAERGGQLVSYMGPYPKSFNYYLDQNVMSAELFGLMYESLLGQNGETLEWEPMLAEKCEVGDDGKTFTFTMNKKARWSDGRPVTAEDVAWTVEAVADEKNLTGPHKIALERFEGVEVTEDGKVRFRAREVHWENMQALAGLAVLPKHAWEGKDFNLQNFEFPVVSGPYRIGEVKEGIQVTMERREDWWAGGEKRFGGMANFERLVFRFFEDRENAFEAFLRGELDVFPVYTASVWAERTDGERFDKNWIVKQDVANRKPTGFQGVALNQRRPPLDDVRVRRALAHLYNRERMNETLMHGAYFLHRSYYEDLYGGEAACTNEMLGFDPEEARRLLAEAGWSAGEDGWLRKGGRVLELTYLSRGGSDDKFTAIFQEDLKDAGIRLKVEKKDWAAWSRDMDEYHFDLTWAAWSAGLFKDPEPMWSSKEADREAGQNLTGFKNEEVDRLIESTRTEFDAAKRHATVREIDAILTREVPYILLWNKMGTRLLFWNKFGRPKQPLGKYGDERSAHWYWWADAGAAADLEAAVKGGKRLPKEPGRVEWKDEESEP